MKRRVHAAALLLGLVSLFTAPPAGAQTGIVSTKHNLSLTGPGEIKALTEDRICVFCHTPHNATPRTPLWNKSLNAVNYVLYASSTMLAVPSQPTGPSRLCLSCHDGTLALGEVIRPSEGISMTVSGGIPSGRSSYLGVSLAGDHPVSFSYFSSLPNPDLSPAPPSELLFYGDGTMHCTTCHDPHDNANRKFLAVDGANGGLCTRCHTMTGWPGTPHNTALSTWNGTPPNPWPRTGVGTEFSWTTVRQNGCENCHAPHNAPAQKRLLNCNTELGPCNPATEEGVCYPCHNGNLVPQNKNISAQFAKASRHAIEATIGVHDPAEYPRMMFNHVECADCHNSHMANSAKTAAAPLASGRLDGVGGVTINDTIVKPALNEYEICFKCHASPTAQSIFPPVPRVASEANTRLEFRTGNPSFHPVAGLGASSDVPSLIAPLTAASMIYCTDCHSDESVLDGGSGSRGPHGSQYAPILKLPNRTTFDFAYSSGGFALCWSCHYETSVLSDNTFQRNTVSGRGGHSGHLGAPVYAPCSACHDPHGVRDDGISGSHKRLMNFDTRHATALPGWGYSVPVFSGSGNRSGNCALVCHDASGNTKVHDGSSTFSYGGGAAFGPGSVLTQW